jgi:hypothetical protein
MWITIAIDDAIHAEAKSVAVETNRTLGEVVEEALRERLARRRAAGRGHSTRLPTSGGGGLMPGVDLDNTSDLRHLLDGQRPPYYVVRTWYVRVFRLIVGAPA